MAGFQQHHGLKRREPDDLVQDLLNVSLSPPKKLRTSDFGATSRSGLGSNFASPRVGSESPWGLSLGNPTPPTLAVSSWGAISSPPARPVVTEGEKALVLYRPVTPPMFPGGPPVGSVDFPYKVNSAMLPIPQGTDSELTSHQLDCQSACSSDTDTLSGHGLFQALDLSGGPIAYLGQRRLNRVSSCSSLPRFSIDNEDQVMVEEIDNKSPDLAVIPWVPMTPAVGPPKIRPIIEEVDDDSPEVVDDAMVDEDSMEVVNEDQVVITEDSTSQPMAGPFGSPISNFSAPWQAEVLQTPFSTPMWSH